MKVTDEGLKLIKQFEGFRADAYRDAVGVWTIGFGHTSMAGNPDVYAGMRMTQQEADVVLRSDVAQVEVGVRGGLTVDLTDQQFSALVSFAYNVGLGNFMRSSVRKAINQGDFQAVPRRLQMWTKAGNRVLPGLVRRRAAEAALFIGGAADAASRPAETIDTKPVLRSKTIVSAALALLLAALQAWLSLSLKLSSIVVLLLLAAALGLIIYERWKKLKEEGV